MKNNYIYVLDRLINKPVKLSLKKPLNIKYWTKILYKKQPKDKQLLIWTVLWYPTPTDKDWILEKVFDKKDQQKLKQLEKEAKELFLIFKQEFKKEFPEAVPINARMWRWKSTIYFYFYADTRFNFSDFVKEFRKKIGMNFFLYQVGARERVRLSPASSYRECPTSGKGQLCCVMYKHPLPSVETETVIIQNLEARWVESIKGFCGKLKCCLNFEQPIYEEALKNYPLKWEQFEYDWKQYVCLSNNIFTWETTAKEVETWEVHRLLLNQPLVQCSNCKL